MGGAEHAGGGLYDAVAPFPPQFNLCDYYLDRNLREGRADKVALLCGDERRTYAQIATRVRKLAAALRRAKLRPEERVLIVLPDGFEFAEAWFATLRAGGVFAMVNPLMKREQFEYYLGYTKARIVVTHSDVLPEIAAAARASRFCETVLVVGADAGGFTPYEQALGAEREDSELAQLEPTGPDDLAGWLFTSGSTGHPKGCVHAHSDFAYNTETYALRIAGYRESDVCLSVPKLFFGYATGTNLMFPFRVGATAVLFPGRATADELLDQIAAHRPTFLTGVPTMFNNLLRSERIAGADLSSLRIALSAGEALPAQLYAEWKQRTGVEILDGIGSAEMFHIYISNSPGDVKLGSLGRIVPGYEAQIVDAHGREVPHGEPGRLRVRGGSTALCYWGDKRKSRETFQGEWCTSADIFRRDAEGYFYYEGRDDDLLKVSGIFVSPLEIENVLLAHSCVAEVCVVGYEDEEGLTKPLAFVVPRAGVAPDEALAVQLKAHCKEHMAPYKYPRWFEWRDALPKNDRGKVARKDLKAELAARRTR
jgi:benzoate-CoA ligase family protein